MREVETKRGKYNIVNDKEKVYAVSVYDKDDCFEFDTDVSDDEIVERINETFEEEETSRELSICPKCGFQFIDDLRNRADENGEVSICPMCGFLFI